MADYCIMLLNRLHYSVLVSLNQFFNSIVSLEKRYKYWSIVSQIVTQNTVLKMCLSTRYKIHFSYLRHVSNLDTCISDTTQHWPLI